MEWKKAFQLASVYVGTVVGAGFATGREIVEFFSKFGSLGILGIFIAGFCFMYFGTKIMLLALQIGAKSYYQLNRYIFGPFFAPVINIIMSGMLVGVTAVMLSGAGSVFEEQLQLSKSVGVVVTILLALIVLVVGTKGLVFVNMLIVPVLIMCSLLLAFLSFGLPQFFERVGKLEQTDWRFFSSAFAYVAFNVTLAQAVLVPAAFEIGDRRVVKVGGALGGFILMIILFSSHLTLVQLPDPERFHIPMAVMMNRLAPFLSMMFIFMVYGEIFSSIIGNIYGLERFIRKKIRLHPLWIGLFIFFIAFFLSQIDYGVLLGTLYPVFGYMSLVFLFLVVIR